MGDGDLLGVASRRGGGSPGGRCNVHRRGRAGATAAASSPAGRAAPRSSVAAVDRRSQWPHARRPRIGRSTQRGRDKRGWCTWAGSGRCGAARSAGSAGLRGGGRRRAKENRRVGRGARCCGAGRRRQWQGGPPCVALSLAKVAAGGHACVRGMDRARPSLPPLLDDAACVATSAAAAVAATAAIAFSCP